MTEIFHSAAFRLKEAVRKVRAGHLTAGRHAPYIFPRSRRSFYDALKRGLFQKPSACIWK